MATTDQYVIVGDVMDYKQGIRFLGGNVDDQVQINAAGAAMANVSYYGTLAAWIMVPDRTGTYGILSFGDDNVVEHITLRIAAGKLEAECNDNTTVQWKYVTAANTITPHRWHHVAVTHDGCCPKLYINGVEMTLTKTTNTTPVSWFKACAGIDAGSIGASEMTGDAALTQEFTGYISQAAVWASATDPAAALSNNDIRLAMKDPTTVQAASLHNYWLMDTDVVDAGTGADPGTIVGDIIYTTGCAFGSRLTFGCGIPVVADKLVIAATDSVGVAHVGQAA
jgi:hypothetical protein